MEAEVAPAVVEATPEPTVISMMLASDEDPLSSVSSREEMLKEMGEWASRYELVAAMGYVAFLLAVGKIINNLGKVAKFRLTPPSAIIAGFLGLALTETVSAFSSFLQVEMEASFHSIELNIVNFVFTALVLGFTAGGRVRMNLKVILGNIWHEGMPMLLYSQALIWGNSSFALAICGIYRLWNPKISEYEGGLVTLGLEAGRDLLPSRVKFKEESLAVVHLADSAGLAISIIVGVLLVMFRRVSPNQKQEWFGIGVYGNQGGGPLTSREHFSRKKADTEDPGALQAQRFFSFSAAEGEPKEGEEVSPGTAVDPVGPPPSPEESKFEEASLGTHIGLMALSVFLGYLLNLSLKYVELNREFLRNHHLISGIRLFKVCMVAAVCSMACVRSLSNLTFKVDWFHRLAGYLLDIMATAAISSMRFDYYRKVANLELVIIIILGCVLWNIVAFFFIAKRMFPNFWYARGVTLMGDALGHSWVGLLLARALDPQLRTPVPMAFTYKLLVFFVPGSGGKNNIVISCIDIFGEWVTLVICLFMLWFWMRIFDRHYARRWPDRNVSPRKPEGYGDRRDSHEEEDHVELLGGVVGPPEARPELDADANLPQLSDPSVILSTSQIKKLVACLPDRDAIRNWTKVFCMSRDGANLQTLLYKCMKEKKYHSFLMIVEDSWGYIFGGYISTALKNSTAYYGTGECFVFKFHPDFNVYRWTGKNDYFVLSNPQHLAMGGGGGGFAFQLDDELDSGVSGPSDTFGNPRLSSRGMFKCLSVEVWAFEELGVAI